jgi:hypothetical protein
MARRRGTWKSPSNPFASLCARRRVTTHPAPRPPPSGAGTKRAVLHHVDGPHPGQEALRDPDATWAKFWRGVGSRGAPWRLSPLPPQARAAPLLPYSPIQVHPRPLTLPRIGCVRTKETAEKLQGRIFSATGRHEANRWDGSLAVEVAGPDPAPSEGSAVGVDLGLKAFATLPDGTRGAAPKPLPKAVRRQHRQRLHRRAAAGRRPWAWLACLGDSGMSQCLWGLERGAI